MLTTRSILSATIIAAMATLATPPTQSQAAENTVVVELFTSQGCNSCPPADRLLHELSEKPGVVALAHHVDYWNYIGWTDPFSSKQASLRQRHYARRLGLWAPYTPQMVINGQHNVSGGRRKAVLRRLRKSSDQGNVRALTVRREGRNAHVVIPPRKAGDDGYAVIWRADYDRLHTTDVKRGENSGRRLENAHVVRSFERIGAWNENSQDVTIDLEALKGEGRDGVAILIQRDRTGPMLAAALVDLNADKFAAR